MPTPMLFSQLWEFTIQLDAHSGPMSELENDDSRIAVKMLFCQWNESASLHFSSASLHFSSASLHFSSASLHFSPSASADPGLAR